MSEHDLIEQLNFENWIEANLQLVQFIARRIRTPTEIHSIEIFGTGTPLTKKLNRGVDFGILRQLSRWRGKYSLTARAEMYLDERYGESDGHELSEEPLPGL